MAMAVQKVFPSAQCTIGPWIDRGFYYDFYYPEGFSNQDMKKIKKEMYKIIRKDYSAPQGKCRARRLSDAFARSTSRTSSKFWMPSRRSRLHLSHRRRVVDLSRALTWSRRVSSTRRRLTSKASPVHTGGATKRSRCCSVSMARRGKTPEQLQAYNDFKAEAKRRDHRTIGQDLSLFSLQQDNAGGGLVFWHPKGGIHATHD